MSDSNLRIRTLAQLAHGETWRLGLAHDAAHHRLIWITRGQGRMMLDGRLRGIGAHNAVFIPSGSLHSLDLGPQALGQTVLIPDGTALRLPDMPRHLRVRDAQAQSELSGIIEAAQREQAQSRPLSHEALEAHVALMSVWLRRQISMEEHLPSQCSAGERLARRFAQMIPRHYSSGAPMAFYASELGVTPTHLTRCVKAATGKTAADLLTERVVHQARSLLENTRFPACNIAHHLGFGSAAYFTRFMQAHTGRAPSQLRGGVAPAAPGSRTKPQEQITGAGFGRS